MKLTGFTDYSLRVLVYLAAEPARRATIAEIARAFGVSENHLTKVVHALGKCGWVTTIRGNGGGLALASAPSAINVGRVVRDMEGAATLAECFESDGGRCPISGLCRLQRILGEALSSFYAVLDKYTLADLARNQAALAGALGLSRTVAIAVR